VKILALTWKHPLDPTAGGAERYLVEVCNRWMKAGHEVTVFGPREPVNPRVEKSAHLDGPRYIGAGSWLTVFRTARRYLHTDGHLYDRILETVSTRPFAAHRIVGDKAVALYHQTAEEVWNLEYPLPIALLGRRLLEPLWIRQMRSGQIVANSQSTASALRRFGLDCSAVVPPGCDAPETIDVRSAPSSLPQLLWIGRLVRTKRPEDAISALALVRDRFPSATLDVVGGGYLRAQLAGRPRAGVTIHGPLSEPAKRSLLAHTDLLLLPGTREGWGIVAMEAAAYGVPVIAYDVAGLRDAVVDGATGILVAPNPMALAAAACRVLSDPPLWHRLSTAARSRALTYSWDRCALDLLESLTRGSGPAVSQSGSALPSSVSTLQGQLGVGEVELPGAMRDGCGSSPGVQLAAPLGGPRSSRTNGA
jgi:glycosyltransferase involved in cell wall biosynthesis